MHDVDHADMISAIKPGAKGFQVRYSWKSLQPKQGVYDFSAATRADFPLAIFTWLESWYNLHRRHSSLGYLSPINYERMMLPKAA